MNDIFYNIQRIPLEMAEMELSNDSLSLMSPSFVRNCFSVFSSVSGSPMESPIEVELILYFLGALIK